MIGTSSISLHFAPILPGGVTIALAIAVIALTLISLVIFRRGLITRALVAAAFLLILLNPSFLEEQREPIQDTAIVVIDKSASQSFGDRTQLTKDTTNELSKTLANLKGLNIRTVETTGRRDTRLFETLDQSFADIPVQRRAGAIFITDGQVHDAPTDPERQKNYGPVHVLLTGEKNEFDRQLVLTEAPSYGIVGQTVTIRYKVIDTTPTEGNTATILLHANDGNPIAREVPVNAEQSETVTIDHAGQNIFEIEASPVDGELTTVNNRAPVLVNGVRDRLKVLLVSGKPYPGERTWRDLLTSDPGVDLVHFTILRQPDKIDLTPQNELSLIAFPFRELFEVKLYDFDLIIFDQYSLNKILPPFYFTNIANYVQKGGALLEASGPSFAGDDSIYTTSLKDILPAAPTGSLIEAAYKPTITDLGNRHPVTQGLSWGMDAKNKQGWGPWLRQIGVTPKSGDVVMSGAQNQPLLILDHVGQGRVAQLASDEIWLWSRGYKGGGPQAELLRRLAHWLMKEPELEENALAIIPDGDNLIVRRRNLHNVKADVTLRSPDDSTQSLTLNEAADGWLETRVSAPLSGVYSAEDGEQKRFAVIGELNPPEWQSVVSSEKPLQAVTTASGGSTHWLSEEGTPDIRRISGSNRNFGGYGWIGLRDNKAYAVTGIKDIPFLPSWLSASMLLLMAVAAWWHEGRNRRT
ncbi:MAG: hypothetical protein JWO78_1277 [Micavibrio sp.]|nr:hypothetical protein [Micavibrio sp.]